ncbi:unnamed protein product [Parajaminaea phylloscopi]
MSFAFAWPDFSPDFYASAKSMLDAALNRGPKPKVIAADIHVEELNMGTVPPDLDILEIGDLSRDRFRGIFRLTYAGDAHIVLSTKVQANPLSSGASAAGMSTGNTPSYMGAGSSETFAPFGPSATSAAAASVASSSHTRGILFAATPLIVPMRLTLSHVRLRAIIVLVVSKTKGITLVFKNDPLESVQVSSTFDSVAVLAKYLQQEIEGQLKEVFREDLPGIIHRLSQKWLNSRNSSSKPAAGSSADGVAPSSQQDVRGHAPNTTATAQSPQVVVGSPTQPQARRDRKKSMSSAAGVAARSDAAKGSPPLGAHKRRDLGHSDGDEEHDREAAEAHSSGHSSSSSSSSLEIPPPLSEYYNNDLGLAGGIESYDPTYGLRPDEVTVPRDGKGFKGLKTLRKSMQLSRTMRTGQGSADKGSGSRRRPIAAGLGSLLEPEAPIDEGGHAGSSRTTDDELPRGSRKRQDDDMLELEGSASSHSPDEDGDILNPHYDVEDDVPDVPPEDGLSTTSSSWANVDMKPRANQRVAQETDPMVALSSPVDEFTRFGYPPPDAAFSNNAFELDSLASRSLFISDDKPMRAATSTAPSGSRSGRASVKAAKSTGEGGPNEDFARAVDEVPTRRSQAVSRDSPLKASSLSGQSHSKLHAGRHLAVPSPAGSSVGPSRPRPRIFHSSSLLRTSDSYAGLSSASSFSGAASPERGGGMYASSSYFAGMSSGAGGSHPGSSWGRSTGTGGSGTIRGAPRSSGGFEDAGSVGTRGGGSTVGKGRTFRIRSKAERERDRFRETYGFDPEEPGRDGDDGVDGGADSRRRSGEQDEEFEGSDDIDEELGQRRGATGDGESGSGSGSGSKSPLSKSSYSATRTLMTLDPEPVDSSLYDGASAAARRPGQKNGVARQRGGLGSRGLYRLGYGEEGDQ